MFKSAIAATSLSMACSATSLLDSADPRMKLLLSVEVARHGERAPGKIFDFAANPEENFTIPYNLTFTGADSHYVNGLGLRQFFDSHDQFLSQWYDPEEVYVQTTYKQRTIDSARAQLDGLYKQPLSWPDAAEEYHLNTIKMVQDFELHLSNDDCPRFT